MCLINFQFNEHPHYKLIVAANRDEFYNRPTASAHFWEDNPLILAGRDLVQMGTWLGVTKQGRFAALTNFRDPNTETSIKISRGKIVQNYLAGNESPDDFLESLNREKEQYTGFNLIVGNPNELVYYNNIEAEIRDISAGTHGLSNHFLNTPWPKVTKGKAKLREYVLRQKEVQVNALFEILSNDELAPDVDLPETGVGLDLERVLSPLFIKTPKYGTRSATVLLVDNENNVTFVERTYEMGEFKEDNRFTFQLE